MTTTPFHAFYDPDLSHDYQALVLIQDNYLMTIETIEYLTQQKIIKGVGTQYLPSEFDATVLIKLGPTQSHVMIFNTLHSLPVKCFDEQIFHHNLIEWASNNNGQLGFSFDISNDHELMHINCALGEGNITIL